jgi:hypothetical protein
MNDWQPVSYLSLGEAAKAVGIAKGTLSKALKSGKVSYVEKTTAGYRIDPAELFRVFPAKPLETHQSERLATPAETHEILLLRVRLEAAEQRAADLTRALEQSHDEKIRLLSLLPAPIKAPPLRRGLWARIRGKPE